MPRCPSCFVPLTRVEEEGFRKFTCESCFGTWINTLMLTRMVRSPDKIPADSGATLQELAETVAASNTTAVLRCPQCEKEMAKDKFHPMIPVTIDRCKPCGMIWLDVGELGLLRALYRELMTSDEPEIVRRREKIAAAFAQWGVRPTLTDQVLHDANDLGHDFNLLGHFLRAIS